MIGEDRLAPAGPVVVRVEETINPALAGHEGVVYESPPLPRTEALALVRLLVGGDSQTAERDHWRRPVAGGQRSVSLEAVDRRRRGQDWTPVGEGAVR